MPSTLSGSGSSEVSRNRIGLSRPGQYGVLRRCYMDSRQSPTRTPSALPLEPRPAARSLPCASAGEIPLSIPVQLLLCPPRGGLNLAYRLPRAQCFQQVPLRVVEHLRGLPEISRLRPRHLDRGTCRGLPNPHHRKVGVRAGVENEESNGVDHVVTSAGRPRISRRVRASPCRRRGSAPSGAQPILPPADGSLVTL
jgi:hypothetical protein